MTPRSDDLRPRRATRRCDRACAVAAPRQALSPCLSLRCPLPHASRLPGPPDHRHVSRRPSPRRYGAQAAQQEGARDLCPAGQFAPRPRRATTSSRGRRAARLTGQPPPPAAVDDQEARQRRPRGDKPGHRRLVRRVLRCGRRGGLRGAWRVLPSPTALLPHDPPGEGTLLPPVPRPNNPDPPPPNRVPSRAPPRALSCTAHCATPPT